MPTRQYRTSAGGRGVALLVALIAGAGADQGDPPSWRPIGPWGGGAAVLVVDPHDPARVWGVARDTGHFHVSQDGGRT